MGINLANSGSQTAIIDTEHSLYSTTTVGVYVAYIDINNMVAGDILEVRTYIKTSGSGTKRQVLMGVYGPVPPIDKMITTQALLSAAYWEITITQRAGTGRAFPWGIHANT